MPSALLRPVIPNRVARQMYRVVQYACPLDLPRANQHGGVRGRGINGSSALVHAGAFGPAGYSRPAVNATPPYSRRGTFVTADVGASERQVRRGVRGGVHGELPASLDFKRAAEGVAERNTGPSS